MSNKKFNKGSKRYLLQKIVDREISNRNKTLFNCDLKICSLFAKVSSHKKYLNSEAPACLEDSSVFRQSLTDLKENYARDHLNIAEEITYDTFEQRGIKCSLPQSDPLEDTGMHITSNPGFAYD